MASSNFWATITSRLFLFTAIIALSAVGYGVVKSAIRRAEIEHEIQALRTEISKHQAKSTELSRLIDYLNSEEYKEKEARLQFGLQKPGENVVVIPNLTESDSDNTSSTDKTAQSNWQLWLNYFLGIK